MIRLSIIMMALVALLQSTVTYASMPSFMTKRSHYTPLLFFKVPSGTLPECKLCVATIASLGYVLCTHALVTHITHTLCLDTSHSIHQHNVQHTTTIKGDDMEKLIKTIEKENGVQVQRLDIMRDRAAKKLYEKLVEGNLRSPFPLLYHRESLQRVYGLADKDLVRSWSKGRLLPDQNANEKAVTVLGGAGDDEMLGEEEFMDMEELEMEMDQELTPMQRRGKEAMKRRMEEGRKK